ncbi:hypothetical protein [Planctomycetes bacterium K23_9]|uniref:AP2 domain protein n=1 Tax=Stieleria marina TaxID=1930275 RepID=A0A517NRZ5_9BACT|nr:hypothetical protein K239x_18460 [Planctomycetes bacterium K23_9]
MPKPSSTKKVKTIPVPKSIRIDLTGHQYGRLTVLGFAGYRESAPMWKCQCDCGTVADYYRCNLRSGTSTQCVQCRHADLGVRSTTHGQWGSPEYRAWEKVRQSDNVCKRWQSYENFRKDVGPKPSKDHQLSRKVTTSAWKPSNVHWVHRDNVVQQKSNSHLIRFRGRTQTLTAWAREVDLSPAALRSRLESGWTVREALTTEALH